MIKYPDMIHEWHEMTNEQQIDFGIAAVEDYKRVEMPVHDILIKGYFEKDPVCMAAIGLIHDWRKWVSNINYASTMRDENHRSMRFQAVIHLREATGMLEFINRYLPR